jgi:hypothetical protein
MLGGAALAAASSVASLKSRYSCVSVEMDAGACIHPAALAAHPGFPQYSSSDVAASDSD